MQFLGHTITTSGILPNHGNITESVINFPIPKNSKQVKSFIGLTSYYRKFVPNFSSIAEPLHRLTRKKIDFVWDQNCQAAFDTLKQHLVNLPILQFPDFEKTFTLTTDASDYVLGSILSQNHKGDDLPLAYGSRSLKDAERNYSTIEKEMLATR